MSSLDRMKTRVSWKGYNIHDKINVDRKYKSFQAALKDSYQAEYITLNKGTDSEARWRCLINPSRLTEEFDKKVLSIDFDAGVKEGTVFYWDRTEEYWLVNLQQHTEEAYFRGIIARCNYEIDVDGKKYWATVRGPVETTTQWNQAHRTNWNDLNYSMVLQVTKDSKTVDFFSRHQVIKISMFYPDVNTGETLERLDNWKVVATDKYSSDNIIEVYVKEWYNNEAEDIMVEQQEKKEEIQEQELEDQKVQPHIEGPRTVNVYDQDIEYAVIGHDTGIWKVSTKRVNLRDGGDPAHCRLDILYARSAKFTLSFVTNDGKVLSDEIKVNSF